MGVEANRSSVRQERAGPRRDDDRGSCAASTTAVLSAAPACGARSVPAAELAVVPRHDGLDLHLDDEALGPGGLEDGGHVVRVGTGVALEHAAAEGHDAVAVLDDGPAADELDAPQLLVLLTLLDQRRQPRIAPEVQDLLALPVGPERRRPLEE